MKYWIMPPGGANPVLTEESEISAKVASGLLTIKDVVCPEGATSWVPIATHFKFEVPVPPAPAAPAAPAAPPLVDAKPTPAAELPPSGDADASEDDEEESGPETPTSPVVPVSEAERCIIGKGTEQACQGKQFQRGLCQGHYAALRRLVKKNLTTWEEQEKRGNCLAKAKPGVRPHSPRIGAMGSAFISNDEFLARSGKAKAGTSETPHPSLIP